MDYNDLLGRQSSQQSRDEVTQFYVGDIFCIHLGSKYANFQENLSILVQKHLCEQLFSSPLRFEKPTKEKLSQMR